MQYDKLLVIGNGFDLALGLKTSYIDFMEWLMNEHCMDGTDLYEFLSRKLKVKRWIDIENELRVYSNKICNPSESHLNKEGKQKISSKFRREHKSLCDILCEYLKMQVNNNNWIETGLKNQSIKQLLSKVKKEPLYVINFNYTDNTAKATTICVQFLASNKTSLSGNDFAWGTNINYPTIGNWTVHMGSVLKIDDLNLNYDK